LPSVLDSCILRTDEGNEKPLPTVTTSELAQAAGVTRARIGQYRDEGMPGHLGRNKWDSEAALPWIADRRQDSNMPADVTALRARLYGLQGDAQEIRNDILRGNVVLVDSARTIYSAAIAKQVEVGDIWVTQARNAHEQDLRRELWFDLRERIVESVAGVGTALERGEDVATTRLRYAKRVG